MQAGKDSADADSKIEHRSKSADLFVSEFQLLLEYGGDERD